MRVGIGHRQGAFEPGRPLHLGGLKVEGAWGLKAGGDGDVALLALADALRGAAGLDAAEPAPGVPSAVLLAESRVQVRARGLVVGNVDLALVADRPDLGPHLPAMRARIADLLDVEEGAVALKASGSGGLARGEPQGILAWAVALLRAPAALLLALVLLAACAGSGGGVDPETVQETAVGLLTLQGGTVSALLERRGTGPFRRYPLAPDALLEVVAEAAGKARGPDGRPLETVWIRRRARAVVAKEPAPEAKGTGYSEPWRSAMVAMVRPVAGDDEASLLEIHATDKGPFHRGRIDWCGCLPRWIDEVLAGPRLYPGGVKPIR